VAIAVDESLSVGAATTLVDSLRAEVMDHMWAPRPATIIFATRKTRACLRFFLVFEGMIAAIEGGDRRTLFCRCKSKEI
jgi:hypothetical protein